jgi:hypothetical protein
MKHMEGESDPWISIPLIYKRGYCQVEVFGIVTYKILNIFIKILNRLLTPNKTHLTYPMAFPKLTLLEGEYGTPKKKERGPCIN